MKTSHNGLRITEEEWETSLEYTRQALKKYSVGNKESDEVIAIFQLFLRKQREP